MGFPMRIPINMWSINGWMNGIGMLLGLPGFVMVFFTFILASFLRVKAAVKTGFAAILLFSLMSFLLQIFYPHQPSLSDYLIWINVILLVIIDIWLISYIKPSKLIKTEDLLQKQKKQQSKIEEEQELLRQMREYLLKITNVYSRLSFDEIITNLGLRSKYSRMLIRNEIKPKLRMMIEDLIYNNKLKAQIMAEELILTEHQPFQANQGIETNSQNVSLNQASHVPSTPTPYHPQSYHQTGKIISNYLSLGIILILIGVGFFIVGIIAFIIYIPLFSNLYIGEILGGVLIFMGIRYIRKGK